MMINLTDTSANFDLFSKVLFVVDQNEEDICRRAAEAAAAEVGCTCGMKLCCIVDTDTMEVCGICPIN